MVHSAALRSDGPTAINQCVTNQQHEPNTTEQQQAPWDSASQQQQQQQGMPSQAEPPHSPPWRQHLTVRGICVAGLLGVVFCIITIKLNLGSAGLTPSLNIPGGLLSFVLLKLFTQIGSQLTRLQGAASSSSSSTRLTPFTPQENAVVQTMTSACYNLAGYAGFGSYLLAMSYQVYLNLGGVPKGQPGYQADAVIEPNLRQIYPYLLLIAFAGIFALLGFRDLLIINWRLPYPSGAASGLMISSLHAQTVTPTRPNSTETAAEGALPHHSTVAAVGDVGPAAADVSPDRKVRVLGYTALGSFVCDLFKWFFQGPMYSCGFASLPVPFGREALKWTWHFDFQQQYIGAGMLVPHVVAWSMLLGAVLSWGLMWPLLAAREGDWYPAGVDGGDLKGLGGYKIWLSVALLLGEGLYMLVKALMLGIRHLRAHQKLSRHGKPTADPLLPLPALDHDASSHESGQSDGTPESSGTPTDAAIWLDQPPAVHPSIDDNSGSSRHQHQPEHLHHRHFIDQQLCQQRSCPGASGCPSSTAVADGRLGGTTSVGTGHSGIAGVTFKETQQERAAREAVFRASHIPWWLGVAGHVTCAVAGTVGIPLIYHQAKWYVVLVAFLLGPLIALANSVGAGLTDQDNGANYAVIALFVFAAWSADAGGGGGAVIAGCVVMGVVMVFAVSSAVLMQDFRTAYVTQTSPAAMFIGQLIGTALGVICAPLVFWMFWQTGLVGVKSGPYPNPWADVSRGMAIIGTEGFGALPRYCGVLSLVFLASGLSICLIRDLLPRRYGRFAPSPMGMAFSFYIGANNAIDFWVGSLIMLVWEWRLTQTALQLGPLVGAGLIVGDGLWAIPSALLAIGGVSPPLCLKF